MTRPFFGYHMPLLNFPGVADDQLFEHLVSMVQAAEKAGFDMVTVMDHFYQIRGVGPEEAPMLEAYTLLSALAARTSRIHLGSMVSGVTYRNPALVAKMVTTQDIISGGRAILGLGAAWNEDEHKGYGFDFPPMRERMDRLEEALEICHLMFTEERPSFQGTYYRLDRALNNPRPIQPGGPRILIGGSGEKRTLRMVARFGDISNWWGSLDELKHKNDVLEAHCEAVGRDPSTIIRTVMAPVLLVDDAREADALMARIPPERRASLIAATPADAAEALAPYREAGFDGFILRNAMLSTVEALGLAGELITLMQ
ncbi:MAG TPA: LLM class F420-dependent oxidoreductase [Candidatus Limnocylindrales bacterium]